MNNIEYKFIDSSSPYYDDSVQLRYDVFYKPTNSSINGVFDKDEDVSYRLAAILDDKVVGFIRLTINGDSCQISHFVVREDMRGKAFIARNLFENILEKAKENNVHMVYGEIRLPVANAAKRYGFNVSDEIIISKKTGIKHKRIEMKI